MHTLEHFLKGCAWTYIEESDLYSHDFLLTYGAKGMPEKLRFIFLHYGNTMKLKNKSANDFLKMLTECFKDSERNRRFYIFSVQLV